MADGLPVTAINVLGITLFTVGGASVLFILLMYADTLWHIMKNASPLVKTHSAFVLSVYPVSYTYHFAYKTSVISMQEFPSLHNTGHIYSEERVY
jgi:hypothetical protein